MARKKTGVRVTVYLPDALRKRAGDAGLNLSALLRAAVERELRGEGEDARRITGASVSRRQVPGGTELVVFVPEASRASRRR